MQESLDKVMDWFEFGEVVKMLDATDFGWWGNLSKEERCEATLREWCRAQLIRTSRSSAKWSSTGGFIFDCRDDHVGLAFQPHEWYAGDES